MKFFFYLLLMAGAAGAGWYFHTDISREMDARIANRKKEEEQKKTAVKNEVTQEIRKESGAGALLAQLQNPSATPATDTVAPSAKPVPASTVSDPAPARTQAPVDEIDARYPMPVFKTVEQITKDWSAIPSRAFPRTVKTKVPLAFEIGGQAVELPAGSEATAAGMVAGMLIVMHKEDKAGNRIEVPLANTDLRENMTALYERYKEHRRSLVMKQRAHARELRSRSNGASEEQMKLAGPKPEVRAGGVIPVMLDSLKSLNLTELKPDSITSWGNLDFEKIDGIVYWTGTVQCTVENPLFGPQPTEAMALIKDNQVVKWIYTGSREPVQ